MHGPHNTDKLKFFFSLFNNSNFGFRRKKLINLQPHFLDHNNIFAMLQTWERVTKLNKDTIPCLGLVPISFVCFCIAVSSSNSTDLIQIGVSLKSLIESVFKMSTSLCDNYEIEIFIMYVKIVLNV